ncbi:mycofactocin system GMC family oxidoreductase MftG [Streptomyces fulvoviolaceus]|uniref:mycofactocin dehydrogenase MftG n=1 Tax=Streptomyces fulvoviolaceus TaxID=285535 RepID=UPI0004C765BB|nr:mycofactocin system GMC family oxidoreductase MftG [Streptomyces fulvoviolaceus]MCT9082991.1 mycofactocin system GMC family oxidoreductase MftG [Streptomyces fulvoviolaceus]
MEQISNGVRVPSAQRRPDVVVVGAGAAGAVLAARLSEDPDREVLLLDAGPIPRGEAGFGPELLDARLVPGARPDHPAMTSYPVHLTPERLWQVPRGRVLGGSTTVNGGAFVRARRADFDRWAAAGNPAWAYGQVLGFLRDSETDLDFGESDLHGSSGPIRIRRSRPTHPAAEAFRDAARHLGFPAEPDKNDQASPGFGPVPSNSVDGVRRNVGLSYLPPEVLDRPNLRALGGCRALRVVIEHGRATGVVVARDGARSMLDAGTVVLSAGAFATPHLLLLSGLGPAADLMRYGIPVLRDLPAVGARLGDHPQLVLDWATRGDLGEPAESWLGGCLHLASGGEGPDDIEILQSLVPMAGLVGGVVRVPDAPLSFLVSVQPSEPGGRLRLASADPDALPRIDYGFLSTGEDFRRLREAVRVTAALLDSPPLAAMSKGLTDPGPDVLGDDRTLDRWIREHLSTSQHTCGTVPMGPADDLRRAAVDQFGRVHGVRGLRVADTSILPDTPHRGPAATAVLIGEIVADAIRRDLGPS